MFDGLGITVFGPLLLALLCLLLPAVSGARHSRWLALAGSLVSLVAGLNLLAWFRSEPTAGFRAVTTHAWSADLGANWTVGVDAFGAAMLALSGLVTLCATLAAWNESRMPRAYHALVLVLLAGMNGVFVTLDLLVFYVCWEVMLVPMLALVGIWGGAQRRYAALKFFVFTLAGSVMLLVLLVALWNAVPAAGMVVPVDASVLAAHGTDGGAVLHGLKVTSDAAGTATVLVPRGFDIRHLALLWRHWADTSFLGMSLSAFGLLAVLLATLVKIPAFPLHTWLPHAHVQAPTAVSVLLAGVLLKLGVHGIHRVGLPLFPADFVAVAPALGWVGAVGILWASWVALGQSDLKRLVAYSSVAHMGFCILGLATGSAVGVNGALVQAVTHGLSSSLLFLLVGVLYERAHHRDVDGFGGIATVMPRFGWLLLFAALAGAGLPGLSGFVGEFLVIAGSFRANGPFAAMGVCAALSVVLSAAYLLWMVKRVNGGPLRHPAHASFADIRGVELASVLPLVVLVVLLGVVPSLLTDALRPGAEAVAALLGEVRP
ncbi:MAG: dehydrogenase subunit [Planctomycetota bacterium]